MWLRIWSSVRLLWSRWWIFCFDIGWRICWAALRQSAFKAGLCPEEFLSWGRIIIQVHGVPSCLFIFHQFPCKGGAQFGPAASCTRWVWILSSFAWFLARSCHCFLITLYRSLPSQGWFCWADFLASLMDRRFRRQGGDGDKQASVSASMSSPCVSLRTCFSLRMSLHSGGLPWTR